MRQTRSAAAACVLALAACGGEPGAPTPESSEERERPARGQTGTGLRAAALNARCKKVVRETGIRMRVPSRRVGEAFAGYGRRVARAAARIARVYRMLHLRLKELPGAQEDELFGRYLSAMGHTAVQFEYASSHAARNRIELEASFHYPIKMYSQLATLATALDAPSCAPRPTG